MHDAQCRLECLGVMRSECYQIFTNGFFLIPAIEALCALVPIRNEMIWTEHHDRVRSLVEQCGLLSYRLLNLALLFARPNCDNAKREIARQILQQYRFFSANSEYF